jgi:hypothetical protein
MTLADNLRRDRKIVSYVTPDEAELLKILGRDYYHGDADAIRQALAHLTLTKHKHLSNYLRKDLQTLDIVETTP